MQFKYIIEEADTMSIQAGFSVPKRRFKRAVDRNKLKRRIREVHRLNQYSLKESFLNSPKKITVLYIYAKNEILATPEIEFAAKQFYRHLLKY